MMVRLDRVLGHTGEGPVTEVVTEAAAKSNCKGWLARATVRSVEARGAVLDLHFLSAQNRLDAQKNGKLRYQVDPGCGYVAHSCVGKRNDARKYWLALEDDGSRTWCVDGQTLAEWLLAREGRDYHAELAEAVRLVEEREAADPLPPLQGTPRQIAWAVELRRAFVVRLPHRRAAACRKLDAKWWLDHAADLEKLR